MENYTSDSSDTSGTDNNNKNRKKNVDLTYLLMDQQVIDEQLQMMIDNQNKSIEEVENIMLHHNNLEVFPHTIQTFVNLKVLDISNNGLTALPDIFKHCRQLSSLIAKNNSLTNESLPKSFTVNFSLRELNLNGNLLNNFPEQLFDLINLKYLYLGGNQIKNISRNIWKLHW